MTILAFWLVSRIYHLVSATFNNILTTFYTVVTDLSLEIAFDAELCRSIRSCYWSVVGNRLRRRTVSFYTRLFLLIRRWKSPSTPDCVALYTVVTCYWSVVGNRLRRRTVSLYTQLLTYLSLEIAFDAELCRITHSCCWIVVGSRLVSVLWCGSTCCRWSPNMNLNWMFRILYAKILFTRWLTYWHTVTFCWVLIFWWWLIVIWALLDVDQRASERVTVHFWALLQKFCCLTT